MRPACLLAVLATVLSAAACGEPVPGQDAEHGGDAAAETATNGDVMTPPSDSIDTTPAADPPAETVDLRGLWNFQDPAASEERFRELLATLETDDARAEVLTQIARTKGLRRDFDGSHGILDTVEPLLREGAPKPRVRYLLERGRTFNSSDRKPESLPLFTEAFEVAEKAGLHGLAVDALHMLAIAAPAADQLGHTEHAIRYIEGCGDDSVRGWLGPLYNNSGWSYHELGRYEDALATFRKGTQIRQASYDRAPEERKPLAQRPLWIAHWTEARALRSLERYDEALTIQKRLLAERAAAEKPDGFVFEELGELELALGASEEAVRPRFARAWELLKDVKWWVETETDRVARVKRLGGVTE